MLLKINDTILTGNLDISNELSIKSINKIYNVLYSSKTLKELIDSIYIENDFIIIDKNVYNLDPNSCENKNIFILEAIENNKNMYTVLNIIDKINITKKNKIIVIGGGITQDIGGFVSTIYKRGVEWVLIPTTILCMTDSCIGSKVCLNTSSKNILGLFNAPNKIYISDYFLNSLDKDSIISGLGEALKLSLLGNCYNDFLEYYNKNNYINIIKLASSVKKIIIEYDELEKNERRVLNYGHTFGHALESTTNYFIPHGIAVLLGMYLINKIFYDNKYDDVNKIILSMIDEKFLKIKIDFDIFIKHVMNDKKNNGSKICFILLDDYGKSLIIFKEKNEIENKIKDEFLKLFNNY